MRAAYWAAFQAELERLDARQCKTGYACGSACISLAKDCRKNPKAATGRERLRRISELASGNLAEGRGLARLRQGEAAGKLQELQGERQSLAKAKRVVREIRQRRNQEATQQQTARTPDRDRDTAAANIPMSGKRGRDLDREIERNVRAQKAEKQAADRERGRQRREAQKQALELRKQHEKEFIDELAQKMDKPRKEVQGAFRSLTYQQQVQAIEKWVKEKGQPNEQQLKELQELGQGLKAPGGRAAAGRDLEASLRSQLGDLALSDRDLHRNLGSAMQGIAGHLSNLAELEGASLEPWSQSSGKQLAGEAPKSTRRPGRNAREAGQEAEKALREGLAGLAGADRDLFRAGQQFLEAGQRFVGNYSELNQQERQVVLGEEGNHGKKPTLIAPRPGRQPAASQASEARDKEQNDLQVVKKRLKRAQGQLTEAQKLYKLYGSESQRQRVEQLQKAVESYKRVLSPEYRLNRGQTVEEISRTAGGGRYSTNPKQTAAEKAASTRLAKQQRLNELGRKLYERGLTTAEKAEYESLQPKRRRRTDSIYHSAYKSELQALRGRVA